jgi:hypothetical protein
MSNASLPSNLTVNRTRFSRVLETCKPTFDVLSETSATSGCVTTSAGQFSRSTEHVTLSPPAASRQQERRHCSREDPPHLHSLRPRCWLDVTSAYQFRIRPATG